MKSLKKSLAMFLAVVMLVSSFSFAGIAAETSDVIYSVETYFMDTFGVYPSVPDEIAEYYANAGETVVLSAEEKEGFTFDSEESIVEFEVQADGSSVGKIFYSRNKYKATYIYEDLLGAQSEESSVYFEAEIPGFEANPSGKPAKQGYNFIMWSLDETERISVPAVMPAYDIEMYPIYEIKTYTFTFDAGEGGSFSNGMQTITYEYKYGEIPVIPESPSMPHMEFIDWDNNIPETVTSNMAFGAMYNEITYAAIFMDGEDEISYMDGYFYGDIIEDLDIPEGYEAWTLSDGTYVSFPYTVTGNVVFYASAAPSEYTVRFYLDINDSEPYEEFSVLQGEEIDFPAEPEKIGHTFVRWTPDITVMPNEDVDFIAEWEVNLYTVNFDTNGGTEISPLTFEYGSNIELTEIPARDGFVFVGWNGMPEDGKMPANDIALTAEWKKYVDPDSLNIRTEIYRQDEVTGEWVVADKVERGETVKARVFIETGFAVGEGQVLCFFNEDVFTIEDLNGDPLVLNPSPTATTSVYSVEGSCATPPKTHSTFEDLVNFGYISEEFLETHTPVTFRFGFTSFKCHSISGDEWFAEFELTAKEDAVGEGNFFVVPETIANSGDGYYAYISFTRGVEGESSLENVEDMFGWDASTTVESNPVSTGYGRIIFDANGGIFNSSGNDILSVDYIVGEPVSDYENPVKTGYDLSGWKEQLPDKMTEEIIKVEAQWTPSNDTPFTIRLHYYDYSENGDAELKNKLITFYGTTGYTVKFSTHTPSHPGSYSIYIALIEDLKPHIPEYNYIYDFERLNNSGHNKTIKADGSTIIDIYCDKLKHEVHLHPGAGNIGGENIGYYGELIISVPHGEYLKDNIPDNIPYRAGYEFAGWEYDPELRVFDDIDTMIYAIWDPNVYTINFYWGGKIVETVTAECGSSYPIPGSYREGYSVYFWYNNENDDDHYRGQIPPYNADYCPMYHPNVHHIYYDAGAGKFSNGKSIESVYILYDDIVAEREVPADPERSGYVFVGWDKELPERMPDEDITLYAVWEPIVPETSTTQTTTQVTTTESVTDPITTQPSVTEPVTEPSTTEPVTEPSTTEPITEPSTQPTTATTTKPVTTTKPTTVHTHSLKTVIENATCEKEGKKYSVCNDCGKTVGNITVIPALGHIAGDWQIVLEPTYDTEGKKIRKCVRNGCGKILEEAVIPVLEPETVEFSIKTPSRTTISYGDSIYLHAVVELPAGAEVVWEASNSNFSYSTSSDGKTCLISPVSSGETTFTAKVVDEKGNVISETDTQVMTSNAGFFQKIIAFFKKLFGLTKVYPDKVVTVYDK